MWKYFKAGDTEVHIVKPNGEHVVSLTVTENTTGHYALEKNAALIAAAPDLLDALLTALCYLEDCEYSDEYKPGSVKANVTKARAAIAKATPFDGE